ncbi:hypothetical protein AAF712_010564 [Marasmius tenuissimus]|uniref:BTB domain-containing protein n=1 Tax=Marasmius tenuissimus TaxID=585030 RepID=A0ABR2ZMP2_9AGAR
MSFGEKFVATDNIKAILDSYPFSIGIFREILQNSDDARASEQVFVLDSRTHPSDNLKPRLQESQGPSLLAYNDSHFSEEDWEALQTVHSSSKRTDTSKIGKYGIGFRSCYHITDYPQIISEGSLAIFDPHNHIFPGGGIRVDITTCDDHYSDVITAFGSVLPPEHVGPIDGTAFRFPLRTDSGSKISSKIVKAEELKELLRKFVEEELDIVLLFLRHVRIIKIYLVDEDGTRTLHSRCEITRPEPQQLGGEYRLGSCEVTSEIAGRANAETASWYILHGDFPAGGASKLLSDRLKHDVSAVLQKNKLSPGMALAIQRDRLEVLGQGRLFTFLPLPLATGFPVHVHGLFSLTQSRQNLRNTGEIKGVLESSDDRVFLGWNEMLFDSYLPKIWARLLLVLSETSCTRIFDAWPKAQPNVQCGDSANWKAIPRRLTEVLVQAGHSVWPVNDDGRVKFFSLGEVFLLSDSALQGAPVVEVLARAGVNITRLPSYIFEILLRDHGDRLDIHSLDPPSLAQHLKEHPIKLTHLTSPDKDILLEYLVSDQQLQNIIDLPIVRLPQDRFVALGRRSFSFSSVPSSKHTLLSKAHFDIFGSLDDQAIALHLLPERASSLLESRGPSELDVRLLDNTRVVSYLRSHLSPPTAWVLQFWTWFMTSWGSQDALFSSINSFNLVPCTDGRMRPLSELVFISPSDRVLERGLQKLGISFLSVDFPSSAREFLIRKSCVKRLDATGALLERVDTRAQLDAGESKSLLNHILSQPGSYGGLATRHRTILRQLPLFPLLTPSSDGRSIDRQTGRLPVGRDVQGIVDVGAVVNNLLLPPVSNVSFIDVSSMGDSVLSLVEPGRRSLSIQDLLRLSLRNFQSQPERFHCSLVKYIAANRYSIPSSITDSLGDIPFLRTRTGNLRRPKEVIDPSSRVAGLYAGYSEEWLPTNENSLTQDLLQLGLLQKKLSTYIIDERITYISSSSTPSSLSGRLARLLLDQIQYEHYDCSGIKVVSQRRWLPTENGLRSHEECLDPGMYSLGRALFDEVLDVVPSVPVRLRSRLGWTSTVPLPILFDQFKRVVDKQDAAKLSVVVKELSSRQLSAQNFESLKSIVGDRPWISGDKLKLVPTSRAVFSTESVTGQSIPGFHELKFSLDQHRRQFYLSMGCCETPSVPAMLSVLQGLKEVKGGRPESIARRAITLLECMPSALPPDQKQQLMIPDNTCVLHPIEDVVYRDVDGPMLFDTDLHFAHPLINHTLAAKLEIPFLGHRALNIENLADYDMEEKLTTKINNTLTQYSSQQLLTEMLANAIDAGASRFGVFVDDSVAGTENLLSPSMAVFQKRPSLVVWNDATFSQGDFKGICNLGMGGKHDRSDSIGQFGLGALTMFHVTEMPMIVSGRSVLFLDPSKIQLPFGNHAATLLNWTQIAKTYSDHLAPLEGVFNFSKDSEPYNGTLFRLPLKDKFSATQILQEFIAPFELRARQSMLFSPIQSIGAFHRNRQGVVQERWLLNATRQVDHEDPVFVSTRVYITAQSRSKARTSRRVFRADSPPHKPLAPAQAIISGKESSRVIEMLSVLDTRNRVVFDAEAKDLFCRLDGAVRMVDGDLVRSEILRADTGFREWIVSKVTKTACLETLIRFIVPSSSDCINISDLMDLPLIPLSNGDLGRFGTAATYYFTPPHSKSLPEFLKLFPPNRLIDPMFNLPIKLQGKGLNVSQLSPKAVCNLLRGRIPEGGCMNVTPQQAQLIQLFWEVLPELPDDTVGELTTFTLLPTIAGDYLSIDYYRNSSVIVATSADEPWLLQCVTELGVVVIKRGHIKHLPPQFDSKKGPLLKALLSFFQDSSLLSIHSKIAGWDPIVHERFAAWLRDGLSRIHPFAKNLKSLAKGLPIWSVFAPTNASTIGGMVLRPIDGISMLSSTLTSKTDFIKQFITISFAPFSYLLEQIGVSVIEEDGILPLLQLPDILVARNIMPYKSLLSTALRKGYSGRIFVPNDGRIMTAVGSLYAHDPLFLATFTVDDFPHEEFRQLEKLHLRQRGLNVQEDLDIPLFTRCAQAFHDNRRDDSQTKLSRARVMFQIYSEDLPLHAGRVPYWGGLDHLRFIPSDDDTAQRRTWRQYITAKPNIVSPSEVILGDHAAIAWTQRTFLELPPHSRLTLANSGFGVPSATEVVAHLQTLMRIATDHPSNTQILHDLTETYKWLQAHHEEAKLSLSSIHDHHIFLNVDDPQKDSWDGRWTTADNLLFNLFYDTGGCHRIRKFLARFPALLRASGVKELENPEVPQARLTSNEIFFRNQRTRFAAMREEKKLVDVKFVTESGEQEFWAHRSFLASVSDYFESLFCAGMEESRVASTHDPVVVSVKDYDPTSIGSVLTFLYTGSRPEVLRSDDMDTSEDIEAAALGRLFDIIKLSHYWRVRDVFEDMQVRMIEQRMINPGTVSAILEEATKYDAEHLVNACTRFMANNAEIMSTLQMSE